MEVVKRSRFWIAFTALVGMTGAVFVLFAVESYFDPFDDRTFDADVWARGDLDTRSSMARDATHRVRPEMAEAEVLRLLGPPDGIENTRELTRNAPRGAEITYLYQLGTSGLSCLRGLDSAFVWVHFDGNGRVITATISGE